jgi:hypothetical protein
MQQHRRRPAPTKGHGVDTGADAGVDDADVDADGLEMDYNAGGHNTAPEDGFVDIVGSITSFLRIVVLVVLPRWLGEYVLDLFSGYGARF